jgi:rhodanese-related sulfurtransferase
MSIVSFLIEHAAIVGGIIVVLLAIFALEAFEGQKQKFALDLAKGIQWVNAGSHQWVDVRALDAFNVAHIMNAKHVSQLKKEKSKTSKKIIAYCDDGTQSAKWAEQNQAHYLKEGMRAWQQAKLPIITNQVEETTS